MKAKLKTLKRGQTFYGAGIQWLVLGHTNSSQGLPIVTHIVSTGIVERRAFDEKNRNDLGVSTLLAYLNGEFLERLEDAFGEGAVAEQFIDLTSNDGLKDYGNVKAKVGLLIVYVFFGIVLGIPVTAALAAAPFAPGWEEAP